MCPHYLHSPIKKEKAFPLNPRGGYDSPYTPSPAHPLCSISGINMQKSNISHGKPKHAKKRNPQTVWELTVSDASGPCRLLTRRWSEAQEEDNGKVVVKNRTGWKGSSNTKKTCSAFPCCTDAVSGIASM